MLVSHCHDHLNNVLIFCEKVITYEKNKIKSAVYYYCSCKQFQSRELALLTLCLLRITCVLTVLTVLSSWGFFSYLISPCCSKSTTTTRRNRKAAILPETAMHIYNRHLT